MTRILFRTVQVALLLLYSVSVLGADVELLGLRPDEAIERLGAPVSVYISTSEETELEAVTFFYDDFRYLYFHDNRVWQVRHDDRSEQTLHGADVGISREQLLSSFGTPAHDDGDSVTFALEDRGFPVRLRAFFEENTVIDLYLYRADF